MKKNSFFIFLIFLVLGIGYCFPNPSLIMADFDTGWETNYHFAAPVSDSTLSIIQIPFFQGPGAGTTAVPNLSFNVVATKVLSESISVVLTWVSSGTTSCTASSDPVSSQWDGPVNLSGSQAINDIAASTSVYLKCSGPGGSINKGILFSKISGPPTLTLYVDPANLFSDKSATLTWVSTKATSCTASSSPTNDQWNGAKDLSGSQTISNITSNIEVSLNCIGPGGWITKGVAYSPDNTSNHRPTLTFSAGPVKISPGDSTTITWSSTNATSCTASSSPTNDQWNGTKNTSGSQTISNITTDTKFALTCPGAGGDANDVVSIVLNNNALNQEPSYPPTLTLYANPVNISANGSTLLSWASANATSCTASSSPTNDQWNGTKNLSGSQNINNITNNTTFSLACAGPAGNINDAALVSLNNPSSQSAQTTINQILSQISQLQSQLATIQGQQSSSVNGNPAWCYTFARSLKYKDSGYDVGALQAALQKEGLLDIPKLTTYFGQLTKNAVIAFQEKYKNEILAPYGLAKGTGYAGNATIKKLNELYGCK